jgi:hypothetical protein
MAGRKNHSPKDIVRLLQRYDGMSVDDAKELKELRLEKGSNVKGGMPPALWNHRCPLGYDATTLSAAVAVSRL